MDTLLPDRLFICYLTRSAEREDDLREEHGKIISENHDTLMAGHLGVKRTLSLLTRKGHGWKGM
jgi:hypothetical protein